MTKMQNRSTATPPPPPPPPPHLRDPDTHMLGKQNAPQQKDSPLASGFFLSVSLKRSQLQREPSVLGGINHQNGLCDCFICPPSLITWVWLKKPVPKWIPGNWKHGPNPAVCPAC